jgi:hypothetical protein
VSPCERIVFPGGDVGWMCGTPVKDEAPACSECGAAGAEFLCDGPAPAGSARVTCDAPLCERCTSRTSPVVTVPTDPADRIALRFAGGNLHAPIGDPLSGPERREWRELAAHLLEAEPHDYCRRCAKGGR